MESGIVGFEIRNPTNDSNPESSSTDKDWNPKYTVKNRESKTVLDSITRKVQRKSFFKLAIRPGKLKQAYTR